MKKIILAATLLCVTAIPMSVSAEKIGFVNVTRLFNEYAKAKGIDKMIEAKFSGPKNEIEKLVVDIKALEKEIKTNELLMSESKLTKSKKKLQEMVTDYRSKGMALEKELQEVRNREMTDFRKIVFEVTQAYAEDKKFDLIVNEGVMYVSSKLDITDDILSRVNKKAN